MATDENRLGQWAMIARIAAAVIALVALVLGGGFFYNELWHVPDLRYSVLPTYNVGQVAFSGLIIENRGRVPAHSVSIILSDLEHPIESLHMPGPHESVDTTWDAQHPSTEVAIRMERLSEEISLSIYMLTSGPVELVEGKTFTITSDRGKARLSAEETLQAGRGLGLAVSVAGGFVIGLLLVLMFPISLAIVSLISPRLRRTQ